MRTPSVASIKNNKLGRIRQQEPREGSKLRQVYDQLTQHPGAPICLRECYPDLAKLAMAITQLQDFYGLDVRSWNALTHQRKGAPAGTYMLVGEYTEDGQYVDYIADKAQ